MESELESLQGAEKGSNIIALTARLSHLIPVQKIHTYLIHLIINFHNF